MKLVWFIIFLFLSFPALAECSNYGGLLGDCAATLGSQPPGHPVPPGDYRSAGTFILRGAGCIHPGARFAFHSSFRCTQPGCQAAGVPGKVLDPAGNAFQMQAFAQYPSLQRELRRRHAFGGIGLTPFSAAEISRLTGLPLCGG